MASPRPLLRTRAWFDPGGWPAALLLAGALGLAFWLLALASTAGTPPGTPPDEWAHITYVHETTTGPNLLPDYKQSRILHAGKTRNYLGHPPLYYSLLGVAGRAFSLDAEADYRVFRAISAGFVALGLALWLLIARLLGFKLSPATALVLSVCAVPMFPYLAGSINNDNLAYLAVAIAFLGLAGLDRWPRIAWYIGAIGLGMALLAKGTAGLFLVLVFGMWFLATVTGSSRRMLLNRHFFIAILGLTLAVGGYYAFAYLHYGAFLPTSGTLRAGMAPPAEPMAFAAFLREFVFEMARHFTMIVDHAPVAPLGTTGKWLCFASIGLQAVAFFGSISARWRGSAGRLAAIIVVASTATLAVHIAITWEAYLRLGGIYSTQPRYYFYLLPGFAVFAFASYRDNLWSVRLFRAFVVVVIVASVLIPFQTIRVERLKHAPPQVIEFPLVPASGLQSELELDRGNAGSIDRAHSVGSTIELRGWAVDIASSRSADRLDIYYGGLFVGTITPNRSRPDVAAALRDSDARNAGFEGSIEGVPPGVSPCDLQYASVQRSGRPVEILPSSAICP
jgi:hypothetical protein